MSKADHYNVVLKIKLNDQNIKNGFVEFKLDPYRICHEYEVGGGPREHMLKKLLRGGSKLHTGKDVIEELQSCLDRWEEMVFEDETNGSK